MEAAYIAGIEIVLIVVFTYEHSIVFCQLYVDAVM